MKKRSFYINIFFLFTFLISANPSQALCISKEKANLRKGPGTKYEILWQVFQFMPFKQLGIKGNWKKVQDLDGDIYWVHGALTTAKYKCAVIKNNQTNLREGPGTKYPQVKWSPVDKYFSIKVLKIQNNWVRIEDATGDKAWIYKPLIWIH